LTIGSVVLAIPILCVLVFLVDKAHSGAPFIEHHSSQAAPPAGDVPQQSDTQDPSHGVKITVDQPSAGTGTQSTVNSQPGAENAPRAASSSRSDENETGGPGDEPTGRTSVNHGGTEPIDREGASSPVTVSADDAAKQLMESRTPIYPPGAKASGVAGTVELEGTISKDGTVKDLRVVSGPAELRQAALNSVRAWRYRPFMVNNEPAEVQTTMNVVFSPNE
jgi:protein TonB